MQTKIRNKRNLILRIKRRKNVDKNKLISNEAEIYVEYINLNNN